MKAERNHERNPFLMGTDIHGCLEVYDGVDKKWRTVFDLDLLNLHNYQMFASLFGIRNTRYQFEPIAPYRGLPQDCTEETQNKYKDDNGFREEESVDAHSVSWISWKELEAIDWDEHPGEPEEIWLHDPGSPFTSCYLLEEMKEMSRLTEREIELLRGGEEVSKEGIRYQYFKRRRRDALHAGSHWRLLFDLLQALAEDPMTPEVRLIVWFDN